MNVASHSLEVRVTTYHACLCWVVKDDVPTKLLHGLPGLCCPFCTCQIPGHGTFPLSAQGRRMITPCWQAIAPFHEEEISFRAINISVRLAAGPPHRSLMIYSCPTPGVRDVGQCPRPRLQSTATAAMTTAGPSCTRDSKIFETLAMPMRALQLSVLPLALHDHQMPQHVVNGCQKPAQL